MLDIKEIEKVLGCNNEIASFIVNNQRHLLSVLNDFNGEYFFSLWCNEDIISRARDNGIPELTEKDLFEIKHWIESYHNPEIGINWDVIDTAIDNRLECKYNELIESLKEKYNKIGDNKNYSVNTYLVRESKDIILFNTEEDDNKWCISKYWENGYEEKEFFHYFTGTLEECIDFIDNKLDRILN